MIDSISSSSSAYSAATSSSSRSQSSLSYSQQETLESVLSNYDADNLSADDATAIVSAFQDAGISPSKSLADAMEDLGFDAREVGDLAGVAGGGGAQAAGGMPPPPPPSQEEEDSISDILSELLYSDEDDDSTTSFTNAYSSSSNSSSFENVLDYTSRILNLNDSAKEEVMNLFENYKSENTELSSKDVSTIMKSSLQDILSDENNYNSMSFYA